MRKQTDGFTLFEVLISLMIITVAILSTLMMLPVGLRAEHHARSELIAASTALSLFENFHNPLITFRGHGALAPNLSVNLNEANPAKPPLPSWANRLRDLNLTTSTYAPDFEHMLSGWVQGVSPVPDVIARRFDSDGDEIQNILDQGGCLFYLNPGYLRGLTVSSDRDQAPVLNPPSEAQNLVFAVTGYAQQNTLPSHPLESLPWYEVYPFPPEWVAMRAHGQEFRRGPMDLVAHPLGPGAGAGFSWVDPATNNFYPTDEGRSNNYSSVFPADDQGGGAARSGLEWGDKGMHSTFSGYNNSGWNPVWFDPAPCNYQGLNSDVSQLPIDPDDLNNSAANIQPTGTVGWYQGRNWRYFSKNYPGSPWADGWVAFEKLAGYNADAAGTMSQQAYAQTDPTNSTLMHYERAGWLPCLACLLNTDEPGFDAAWWSQNSMDGGTWVAPVTTDPGQIGAIGPGGMRYVPGRSDNWPGLTANPEDLDNEDYSNAIGAPSSCVPLPTYEMRASYRDKAIDLWNAVSANVTGVYHPNRSSVAGHTPEVDNTELDCDMYEYGPQELDNFVMADPSQVNGTPHPAQVLALSYLAHAAMMITGWNAPFWSYTAGGRIDWDDLTWQTWTPPSGGQSATMGSSEWTWAPSTNGLPYFSKDAKLVATGTTAPIGANNVQIQAGTSTDLCLYAGDEIVFESDYRLWFQATVPSGGWNTSATCQRYRVRNDVYVVAGQIGTMVVDPPLATEIDSTTKSWPDSWANANYNPPIVVATPHPQQFIRVCNEHDKAFARKVHEMCMRWASRYCADNPYDAGAPRMQNHQVMTDKPLTLLDLFNDAAFPSSSPTTSAIRIPRNLPTPGIVSPLESFYRWMNPPNPQPTTWYASNHVGSGNVHELSNFGPGRNNFTAFTSLVYNPQLAPPSTPNPAPNAPWDWRSDDARYWINRHFNAFHRSRELVFWSVNWLSYADSEIAPSQPMDWSKHGRSIVVGSDGQTPVNLIAMNAYDPQEPFAAPQNWGNGQEDGSQYAGNPEQALIWGDSTHNFRYYDLQGNSIWYNFYWLYGTVGPDLNMGHWGADRNANRKLDIGPVPITTRMKADTVARFTYYDPILRLNVNN